MIYKIINKENSQTLSAKAKVADSFLKRLRGLMFKKSIGEDEALIFYKAASIHTFFMRFPIDIIFLNKESKVIKICPNLKPWKMVFCLKSAITIEFQANKASINSLKIGDTLEISPKIL